MVTVADADFDVSMVDVAVTVTVAGFGTVVGAVYTPVVEMVPQALPVQPAPLTVQVTLVGRLLSVALNCCWCPATTFAVVGKIETDTGERMVTIADADLVGSAVRIAVMVTVGGCGAVAGAV